MKTMLTCAAVVVVLGTALWLATEPSPAATVAAERAELVSIAQMLDTVVALHDRGAVIGRYVATVARQNGSAARDAATELGRAGASDLEAHAHELVDVADAIAHGADAATRAKLRAVRQQLGAPPPPEGAR